MGITRITTGDISFGDLGCPGRASLVSQPLAKQQRLTQGYQMGRRWRHVMSEL
jgi:hypothetical protein